MPDLRTVQRLRPLRTTMLLGLLAGAACGDSGAGQPTCPGDPSCEDPCADASCDAPDPCAGEPCAPGTCAADGDVYACTCPAGWAALDGACIDPDDCAGDPCGPGSAGTCTDLGPGDYRCDCAPGRFDDGATCTACPALTGCAAVVCTSTADATCETCEAGFEHADDGGCRAITPCDPDPCGGGLCQPDGAAYRCTCAAGAFFDGATCATCETVAHCEAVECTAADDAACVRCETGWVVDGAGCRDPDDCAGDPCGLGRCEDTGPGTFACSPSERIDGAVGGVAEVETADGTVGVEIGPGAFVDGSGATATGPLRLEVVFGGFDGRLATTGGLAFDALVTADVSLVDDDTGAPLQLAEGARATLVLPLPADVAVPAGEPRPLFRYDPERAAWLVESTGEVHRDGDAVSLVASVSHFSWYGDGTTCATRSGCLEVDCASGSCVRCDAGHALTDGACRDIDDCAGVTACGAGACVDRVGGYTCDCPDGSFGDGTGACTACDPSGVPGCSASTCDGPGTSSCTACEAGWKLVGGSCVDLDDCAAHPCGVGTCTDTGPNRWTCTCPDGHFGDGTPACTACTPSAIAGCTAVTCTAPGDSTCAACAAGYRLDGGACIDVDDCAGVSACGAGTCVDALAGYRCDCPDGTFGDGTPRCTTCTAASDRACVAVTCARAGVSTCAACANGYALVNGRCVDIDDCAGVSCGASGRCVDRVATYTCDCPDGAFGDGTKACAACTPSAAPGCSAVTCTSSGDSTCVACADGWSLSGTACVDVDDCAADPCGAGDCTDTGLGAWTCTCPSGTFGTGTRSCTACPSLPSCAAVTCSAAGASTCTACKPGFELSGGHCVSTDDCIGNLCGAGTCIDGNHAYTCDCPTGTWGDGTPKCTACAAIDGCAQVACTSAADAFCTCGSSFECAWDEPACIVTDGVGRCGMVDACVGDDAREPDDGPGASEQLNAGQTLAGRVCGGAGGASAQESDWFSVFSYDTMIKVVLAWDAVGVDLDVRVVDANGALVSDGDGLRPETVFVPAPPEGEYYVVVTATAGASSTAVDYTLRYDFTCGPEDFWFCPPETPVCDWRGNPFNLPSRCVTSDTCPELGEHEPEDDGPSGATELIGPHVVETNELCGGGLERDWYRFDVAEGEVPRITLDWGRAYTDLDWLLVDALGAPIDSDPEGEPFQAPRTFTGLAAGTYYLALDVRGDADGPVDYWLTYDVLTQDGACPPEAFAFCPAAAPLCIGSPSAGVCGSIDACTGDDDAEPGNDGPRGAVPLAGPFDTVESAICGAYTGPAKGEDDWYVTVVEPGEVMRASLDWDDAGVDLDLYLVDVSGSSPAWSTGNSGTHEAVSHEDVVPGIYYLLVRGYDGAPSAAVPYRLTVDQRPCDDAFGACPVGTGCVGYHAASRCEPVDGCAGDDAREPADDSPAGATSVGPGFTELDGVICGRAADPTAWERDWFTLTKTTYSTALSVSVAWEDAAVDLDLVLRDADGSQIARGRREGTRETIDLSSLATGVYYAVVTRWDGPVGSTAYHFEAATCARLPGCTASRCGEGGVPTCDACVVGDDLDPLTGCTDHDDCDPNPCLNGGACRGGGQIHWCDCPPGWDGDRCEHAYGECRTGFDCDYAAPRCVVSQGLGTCTAIAGCSGDDDREPYDDVPRLSTTLVRDVPTDGKVCDTAGEVDWYTMVVGDSPAEVALEWDDPDVDLDIVAFDAFGAALDFGGTTLARPEHARTPAGHPLVDFAVYAYDGAPVDAVDYTITATYGCTSSFECAERSPACAGGFCRSVDVCQGDYNEGNDDGPADATPVTLGELDRYICGATGTPSEGERDWYRIELDEETPLFATLSWFEAGVDLDLALYDAYGALIATGGGGRPEALASLAHASGPHYVVVRSVSGAPTDAIEYLLDLETCAEIRGCADVTCTTRQDATCLACADGFEPDGHGGCSDVDACEPDPCDGHGCIDMGAGRFQCELAYHGGRVMRGPIAVYPIWYGDWSGREAPKILTDLVRALGGSARWAATSWYADEVGRAVSSTLSVGGQANDAYTQGTTLAMADLRDIVAAAIAGGLPSDPNGIYVVFTAPDVGVAGLCTAHCGWHDHADIDGADRVDRVMALVPDASSACPEACGVLSPSPNGDPGADAMASVLVHVLEAAATDSDFDAWFDGIGLESVDRCAWSFNFAEPLWDGSLANVRLGQRDFLLTDTWLFNGFGCTSEHFAQWLGHPRPAEVFRRGTNPRFPVVRPKAP